MPQTKELNEDNRAIRILTTTTMRYIHLFFHKLQYLTRTAPTVRVAGRESLLCKEPLCSLISLLDGEREHKGSLFPPPHQATLRDEHQRLWPTGIWYREKTLCCLSVSLVDGTFHLFICFIWLVYPGLCMEFIRQQCCRVIFINCKVFI